MANLLESGTQDGVEFTEPTSQENLDKTKEVCIIALKRCIRQYEEHPAKKAAIATVKDLDIT